MVLTLPPPANTVTMDFKNFQQSERQRLLLQRRL